MSFHSHYIGATPLNVQLTAEHHVTVLDVSGEVDLSTAGLLAAAIHLALGREPLRIILDLSEVTFFSAAGLRVLLQLRNSAERQAIDIVLRAPSPAVRRVIDLSGTGNILRIDDNAPAASARPPRARAA